MVEAQAKQGPVIVSTHSDGLLDLRADPVKSAVLCELDGQNATCLRRPNAAALGERLVDYRGLGDLRASGYQGHLFGESGPRT